MRSRCGGDAAAWVTGVLAAPGTQGSWQLGQQEIYSGLEGYGGEGNGTPLQYSCLENPMDGGAWWAAVYGVAVFPAALAANSPEYLVLPEPL